MKDIFTRPRVVFFGHRRLDSKPSLETRKTHRTSTALPAHSVQAVRTDSERQRLRIM